MIITQDNYYSVEANKAYFTASQIKTFLKCPSMWQAERTGLYKRPETPALFHGQYIDTALTEPEVFGQFCQDNASKIFGNRGKKFAAILDIDKAIARVKRDDYFMSMLQGSSQVIIVLEDFHGHPYKCRLDNLNMMEFFLTDLKSCKGLFDEMWTQTSDGGFVKVHWIAHWKYPLQLALYREAIYLEYGFRPHPYIAAMEKTANPNFEVFDLLPKEDGVLSPLSSELARGIETMDKMAELKDLDWRELPACKTCDWCKMNKRLTGPVLFEYKPAMLAF